VRRSIINRIGLAAIAGCIAAGSLAVAGCGGGDDTTTTGAGGASGASGSAPLSKEEFISQANAICADANGQIQALEAPPQNAQSVTEVVPFLEQGFAIASDSATRLEALTPPSELQSERDKLVADTNKQKALTEKLIAAAKADDASQFQALSQQIDAIDKRDDAIARSIGVTECAKNVDPQG
jgi:hypothetical protein